jgi:hypothetical protein
MIFRINNEIHEFKGYSFPLMPHGLASTSTTYWMGSSQIFLGIGIESRLAALHTEVIGLAIMLGFVLGGSLIHVHLAYRIHCHNFSPPFLY